MRVMFPLALFLTVASLLTFACGAQAAEAHPAVPVKEIDALFSEWDRPDSPGCALAVIRDGKILYGRGYGRANLEYPAPITPQTPFHIASVSKQFTAFAIHLLANEGKLSLEDEVRRHLPNLPDFGKPLTIRHLLHHTGGLRDQWALLSLAGWRMEDVITGEDVFQLIGRQRTLNFAPGTEYQYSNTGYTLLGRIVQRVSGQTLRVFAKERIFQPLGMDSTHFHDDHGEIVPGRAYSYTPAEGGGFRKAILHFGTVGATGLFTTVEDMAKWDRNFYEGKVGGKAVLRAMLQKGRLVNGREIPYASGLQYGGYKGLPLLEHEGRDAGFRSYYLRFPRQRFSVILLANVSSLPTVPLAFAVADLFLKEDFRPETKATPPAEAIPPAKVAPELLDAYAGEFWFGHNFFREFLHQEGRLYVRTPGSPPVGLIPRSDIEFVVETSAVTSYRFAKPEKGESPSVVRSAEEGTRTGIRNRPLRFSPQQLRAYEGRYLSEELEVLYTIQERDGKLRLRGGKAEAPMTPLTPNRFDTALGAVEFLHDARQRITGFTLTTEAVRNLRFRKLE
ncbi:MAG: beta-lactamase family protein [Armatimonadetes bacterium]|nr:beta-lactamase family protein [Armatimonadota bacterium]